MAEITEDAEGKTRLELHEEELQAYHRNVRSGVYDPLFQLIEDMINPKEK